MRIKEVLNINGLNKITLVDDEAIFIATEIYNNRTNSIVVEYQQIGVNYTGKEISKNVKDTLDKVLSFVKEEL